MVDRFIIELEPAVWYRDWAGTHRTTNINDAHIFGSAVRATKEIVRACKHRPYPNARVVAVSTVVQPIEETVHIRSLSEQVKAILPRTMYRFSALAPDIASILVDVTSVRNRLELVDPDDIPGMIAEMELAIAGLSTATKEESKRAASERIAPTVREIIRERLPEGVTTTDYARRWGEKPKLTHTVADLDDMPAGAKLWDSVRPSVCYLKAGDGRWTVWWTWTLPDEVPAFGDFDAAVMLESPVPWTATEPVLDPAGAVLEKKPTPEPGGEDEAWKRLWRTEHSR